MRAPGHGRFLSSLENTTIALDKQYSGSTRKSPPPKSAWSVIEGEQLGIVSLADALAKAEAAELDLVEIAPTAKPPVCRIMDFGKFKYRESEEAARGEAQAEADPGQGSEVPARHRRRRLPDQAAQPDPLPGKATRPRSRCASAAARWRTRNSACACWNAFGTTSSRMRVVESVPEAGRPADGDAAGAEEEVVPKPSRPSIPQPSLRPVRPSPPKPLRRNLRRAPPRAANKKELTSCRR